MRVARPRAWLGAVALAIAVIALLVWGFVGNLPQTVSANGLMTGLTGVTQVQSTQTGQVTQVLVLPGKRVRAGTVVLRLVDTSGRTVAVRSRFAGRITGIQAGPGQVVTVGTPLFTLGPATVKAETLYAYLFLSPDQAASVTPGMQVTVTTLNDATFQGRVTAVGDAPASTADLVAAGGSDVLVKELASSPKILARVQPVDRLPASVRNGSLVSATVTLRDRHPVEVVFGS